jgi:hypothetical protein
MSTATDRKRWAGSSIEMRMEAFKELVIRHPQFQSTLQVINDRSEYCRLSKTGRGMVVTSNTGGGKTTLAECYKNERPAHVTATLTTQPVVIFSPPDYVNVAHMGSALLRALGDPAYDIGSADDRKMRAIKLLIKCDTRVLFLDNAHDIPERRRHAGVRDIGLWLRDIIDAAKLLLVMLGTDAVLPLTRGNPQLRSRCPGFETIDYFYPTNAAGLGRLMRFLHEIDERLPLAHGSNLSEQKTAARIGFATHGHPRGINILIGQGLSHCVARGGERIETVDLYSAFNAVHGDARASINPFKVGAEMRKLDRPGEPFEVWNEGIQQLKLRNR